uniref:Uncharacterized protein n=1 Tax=Mola mola TaxID=94237 RepID=A0A3Q3X9D9_MOLML
MLSRVFLVCLSLSVCTEGSPLGCRWMDHRFTQYSQVCLDLLDAMAQNSTNSSTEATEEDTVAFPSELYSQASEAPAEDKLAFAVQVLNEMAALFQEDHSAASWEEKTGDRFVNIITQQAHSLRSCIGSRSHKKKNKRLHVYFKRLSELVLKEMGYSADAWELIRKEIRTHLMKADHMVSSLRTTSLNTVR